MTDVYISDATFAPTNRFYYNIVNGLPVSSDGSGGGGGFADFHARFPNDASIAAGEYQTIALNGAIDFSSVYTLPATYELYEKGEAPLRPPLDHPRRGRL